MANVSKGFDFRHFDFMENCIFLLDESESIIFWGHVGNVCFILNELKLTGLLLTCMNRADIRKLLFASEECMDYFNDKVDNESYETHFGEIWAKIPHFLFKCPTKFCLRRLSQNCQNQFQHIGT